MVVRSILFLWSNYSQFTIDSQDGSWLIQIYLIHKSIAIHLDHDWFKIIWFINRATIIDWTNNRVSTVQILSCAKQTCYHVNDLYWVYCTENSVITCFTFTLLHATTWIENTHPWVIAYHPWILNLLPSKIVCTRPLVSRSAFWDSVEYLTITSHPLGIFRSW